MRAQDAAVLAFAGIGFLSTLTAAALVSWAVWSDVRDRARERRAVRRLQADIEVAGDSLADVIARGRA